MVYHTSSTRELSTWHKNDWNVQCCQREGMRDSHLSSKGRVDMRVAGDDSPLPVYMLGPRHDTGQLTRELLPLR
jgi:hypothetical protein